MITTVEEFCRLRESEIEEEYLRAAHEEAPLEVWRGIIASRPDMRTWVVLNRSVPLEILDELSRDTDTMVRYAVARKRKITEAIALRLAKDPDESVRAALIYNRKLPAVALAVLRADPSPLGQRILREKEAHRAPPPPAADGRGSPH